MKLGVKRTLAILQLCAWSQLGFGILAITPLQSDYFGLLPLVTGVTGIVGLMCSWYKCRIMFTLLAWATTAYVSLRIALSAAACVTNFICYYLLNINICSMCACLYIYKQCEACFVQHVWQATKHAN